MDTPNEQERKKLEAKIAYWKAKADSAERELSVEEHKCFLQSIKLYLLTVDAIAAVGFKNTLGLTVDTEEIGTEDRKQMNEDHKDLTIAIEQGMSLCEFLMFDSARSWLHKTALHKTAQLENPFASMRL